MSSGLSKSLLFLGAMLLLSCSVPGSAAEGTERKLEGALPFGANTMIDIAKEVSPAVVNIVSLTTSSQGRGRVEPRGGSRDDGTRKLRRYFGMDQGEDGNQLRVTGSGIVIRSDGYILTTLHVVQNATEIKVSLADGRSFDAKVIGRDGFTDLALIKVPGTGLQEIRFGDPERLKLGEWVVAIGNQFGLEHTVTCGLISGLHREAKAFTPSFGARTGAVKFIQTDTPINPGSSGGPLLNLRGEVVGINSFIRDDAQNIGFALPASLAREVGEKLMRNGAIAHPYIGIEMRDAIENAPVDAGGVEVTLVKPASPASSAGLEAGDWILEVDQFSVKTPGDVSKAVGVHSPGEKVVMRVKRNGSDKTIIVKVDRLPEEVE
ncbi:MAG: trypsin-like peptidase domain-containing protein [Candidatus Obscuribacterales bacterium]|nr:trypsin-like peptidase domain-containing protein [Candidatus Obscuribacterales bacterium]